MSLPILTTPEGKPLGDSVLLAVYAPFGSDDTLSQFPDNQTLTAATHPLVTALKQVALAGTHVVALVDRVDDFTWLVEIELDDRLVLGLGVGLVQGLLGLDVLQHRGF